MEHPDNSTLQGNKRYNFILSGHSVIFFNNNIELCLYPN